MRHSAEFSTLLGGGRRYLLIDPLRLVPVKVLVLQKEAQILLKLA